MVSTGETLKEFRLNFSEGPSRRCSLRMLKLPSRSKSLGTLEGNIMLLNHYTTSEITDCTVDTSALSAFCQSVPSNSIIRKDNAAEAKVRLSLITSHA